MKTPERFNRAIKALVQAFFNDTLMNADCKACAVGNMVAAGAGTRLVKIINTHTHTVVTENGYDNSLWYSPVTALRKEDEMSEGALDNILMTGYSLRELYNIENAFMKASGEIDHCKASSTKEDIMRTAFNGLMAVVEVLCEIEGLDCTPYKEAFAYTEDFKPVNA